jgi:hypothetical protein
METAAELRRKADAAVRAERFAEAADLYRREAAIYRRNGDLNGAKVEEMKAARYTSSVVLYAHLPDSRPWIPRNLGKWEPPHGCYLGGFIDRDERLGRGITDDNSQVHQDPDDFARRVGKKHASVFWYLSYGRPFPERWATELWRRRVAPHIALEPNQGLEIVRNDTYLRSFAQACARVGGPIFLRFASEMNGDWTRYGGDPVAYKAKWITVQQVMATLAPNVAMLWCVNSIPEAPIARFYPGDDYVDWVGVNFYSVPFYDNDPARPGLADTPVDSLAYVYQQYATRKPIAVCEFGASHVSKADGKDRSDWAARKISELYASLPRLYPRVRLIDIFDMDNLRYAQPGRQLNNYSVTDSDTVQEAYSKAIASDYFLERIGATALSTPIRAMPAKGLSVPRGTLTVSSWARCYADRFTVTYRLDGREVASVSEPGGREASLTLTAAGTVRLAAEVRDPKGRVAARTEAILTVV